MSFKATVSADALHLRRGPGRTFDSLGLLHNNTELTAVGIDITGTWMQVNSDGRQGWCSARYLLPVSGGDAPYLALAAKEIGVKEYPGHNPTDLHPRIRNYLASVNNLSAIDKSTEETAWCSCFMNWCVEQAGLVGTDSAWAKSWGNWRKAIALDKAQTGDFVVFDRSSPGSSGGHVAILVDKDATGKEVLVLGGNQSDAVRYSWYPMDGVKNATHYKVISCQRSK